MARTCRRFVAGNGAAQKDIPYETHCRPAQVSRGEAGIAVYGLFMTPLGWGWALFVWGYALAWFLVNDRVKLLAYQIFDPTKPPLLAKKPVDLTPQIAARAYELYQ